jgi:hypothetical protein
VAGLEDWLTRLRLRPTRHVTDYRPGEVEGRD